MNDFEESDDGTEETGSWPAKREYYLEMIVESDEALSVTTDKLKCRAIRESIVLMQQEIAKGDKEYHRKFHSRRAKRKQRKEQNEIARKELAEQNEKRIALKHKHVLECFDLKERQAQELIKLRSELEKKNIEERHALKAQQSEELRILSEKGEIK